ncbi:tetratricopeptide repeat protein [Sphingomonas immobilis]|nr:tetratricopeptide repeat protein [Sphingomonas sp. CA1-15]
MLETRIEKRTSSRDGRRRSSRTAKRMWRRIGLFAVIAGMAALAVTLFAINAARPHAADPALARDEVRQSIALLDAGNYSAARLHAQNAVTADPKWGLAHALLARTFLALGNGDAAEGELDRATDAGFDPERAHHLYAHAWLLQDDADAALTEAAKAPPRYAGYAVRIGAQALAAQGDVPRAQQVLSDMLDANPRDAAAWADLAQIRADAGNGAGAIDAVGRALAIDGNNLAALTLRSELVRDQYGLTASLPWFEAVLKRDAYYYDALIDYAATLGDVGRYQDMLEATRKALAARPGSADAYYLQAVMAARAGNFDLSRTLFARAKPTIGDTPGALLLGGTLAFKAGAYQQAIDQWQALIDQQPMNLTARRLLGLALLKSGDARGSLDALRPAGLRGDADSYTLMLIARAFEQTGERDWAAKYLDRAAWPAGSGASPFGVDDDTPTLADAVKTAPDEPTARLSYVRGLLESGDRDEALAQAQAIVKMMPGAPTAYLALGDTLAALGRYGEAAAAYRSAAGLRFDEPTMLRMVDALDRAGQRQAALTALTLYLSQNPQSIAAQRIAAHWQIAGGEWDAAIETLENIRQQTGSRDVALLVDLSAAYLGGDDADPDTALAYAKAAYRLAPMNPAAADAYGWALHQTGRDDQALQLLQKAVAIAPGNAQVREHLAAVRKP